MMMMMLEERKGRLLLGVRRASVFNTLSPPGGHLFPKTYILLSVRAIHKVRQKGGVVKESERSGGKRKMAKQKHTTRRK